MKKIMSTEVKVGMTVIIATLILVFGIIWGKGFSLRTAKYQLDIVFENVGGLIIGDPVTVNGVKEGKITLISWHKRQVLCTIELNDHIQLYEDARFSVISAELLAGMKIEIFPGDSPNNINLAKQPFQGSYGGRIVDVGIIMGELAEDISNLTFRIDTTMIMVNNLLQEGSIQDDIKNTISNINKISDDFKSVPADLKLALVNLNETSGQLRAIIENNNEEIVNTFKNISTMSGQLDTIAISMRNLLYKVENRDGTIGRMVNDSTLYNNLNQAILSIDSLAKQIKQDGIEVSLF